MDGGGADLQGHHPVLAGVHQTVHGSVWKIGPRLALCLGLTVQMPKEC